MDRRSNLFRSCKPYLAMISLQFGYAGMNIISKVSLNHGMSHYVLVVYRHAIATLSIAPFALILERLPSPAMIHDQVLDASSSVYGTLTLLVAGRCDPR